MQESPRGTQEISRGLGFAEYVVDAFEQSVVFYWSMWGPLGGPMIRATEQWANMQRRYLRALRQEGPGAATPRGAAVDEGSAGEAKEGTREEIRSTIRESVRRSEEGIREEEPRAGTAPAPVEGRADAEEPPVEDYDSLSVGQVTQRLLELSVEEVERLRDYEAQNRNRPSIMNRYERRLAAARENRRKRVGAAGPGESSAGEE